MSEESIYKLIPEPEQKKQKPPRYTSKYPGTWAWKTTQHRCSLVPSLQPGDIAPTGSTFGVTGSQAPVANMAVGFSC